MTSPRRRRSARWLRAVAASAVGLFLVSMATPAPAGASFPVLPPGQFIEFLTGLDLPVTSPGSSVSLTGSLANPLSGPLTSVNVSFQFYAFNGFPGNDTGPMPAGSAPTFVAPTGPGAVDWVDAPSLSPGEAVPIQLSIDVPSGASPGDYAVRTALDFVLNGTTYLLESRGYFSYSEWTNATVSPGGGSTLNVSRLGVSGVLPETALSVQTNPIPIALYVLLGGALALAAVGGYYASRRGPGSRSGAR